MPPNSVLGKKLLYNEFAGKPLEKDQLLCSVLDCTQGDLNRIRGLESEISRAIGASQLLRKHEKNSLATSGVLAAIMNGNWESPTRHRSRFDYQIKTRYGRAAQKRTESTHLRVPPLQIFREEMGLSVDNLSAAKRCFPHFTASESDWLRGIRIPDHIDYTTLQYLGFAWGDAIPLIRSNSTKTTDVSFYGTKYDMLLYDLIAEKIAAVHHIQPQVKTRLLRGEGRDFSDTIRGAKPKKSIVVEAPYIAISSEAITTWLMHDIGLPAHKKNVLLPRGHERWDVTRARYFYSGIVATKMRVPEGRASHLSHNPIGYINESDEVYCQELLTFSRRVGFPLNTTGKMLYVGTDVVRAMDEERFLANPFHRALVDLPRVVDLMNNDRM